MSHRTGIVFVHPSDEMYGADRVLLEMVTAVDGQVKAVLLPNDIDYPRAQLSRELRTLGVDVRRVPLPVLRRAYLHPVGLLRLLPQLVRTVVLIARLRPRHVHVNTTALILVAPVARLLGCSVVVHVHEELTGPTRHIFNILLSSASRVICVSRFVQSQLRGRALLKSCVIYNGFEFPAPAPAADRDRRIQLVLASRWNAWKGHGTLLEAWAGLARTDLALSIAGGPPPSGHAVDVRGDVRRLGIEDSVEVIGETDAVWDLIARCDAVLVPSIAPDPLPTIAIEAAAGGRACLASDIGGLPEIVADGVTGTLVPPDDVLAWRDALESITREELAAMGRAGRELYSERFVGTRFAREIGALYE